MLDIWHMMLMQCCMRLSQNMARWMKPLHRIIWNAWDHAVATRVMCGVRLTTWTTLHCLVNVNNTYIYQLNVKTWMQKLFLHALRKVKAICLIWLVISPPKCQERKMQRILALLKLKQNDYLNCCYKLIQMKLKNCVCHMVLLKWMNLKKQGGLLLNLCCLLFI